MSDMPPAKSADDSSSSSGEGLEGDPGFEATLTPAPKPEVTPFEATVREPAGSAGGDASSEPTAVGPASTSTTSEARTADPLPLRDAARYIRKGEIARGGMGRIVEIFDRELGRAVAIKELLYRDELLEQRFLREIEITARLQHPSIIAVLEAGRWSNGCAFYAMAKVPGRSVADAIAGAAGLSERLALLHHVTAVAEALAYAHDQGVIHRDLKPANVLVGGFGETVVIDWGLAKRLEEREATTLPSTLSSDTNLTVVGQAMGTPAYMPPEQARGDEVDARADVYALGAMLYHLLAGKTPYADAKAGRDVLAPVLAGPPRPLLELIPEAPADLVTIVDKAMQREPERRYESARALVEDLRRFETGQLVGAHEYSSWDLARRFIGRHRALFAVLGGATMLLVVIGALAVERVRDERDVARQARGVAERERQEAERSRGEAEGLLDFMLTDLREKLDPIGKLEILGLVADRALAYYTARPVDWTHAERAANRSRAYESVSRVLAARGDAAAALQAQRQAVELAEALTERFPADAKVMYRAAEAHGRLADVLMLKDERGEAMAAYKDAERLHRKASELAPGDVGIARAVAIAKHQIGDTLNLEGDAAGALAAHREALELAQALLPRAAGSAEMRRLIATGHTKVAWARFAVRDFDGAFVSARESLAMREQILAQDPDHAVSLRDLSLSYEVIGEMHLELGAYPSAIEQFRRGLEVAEALARLDPSNAEWQRDLGLSHQKLGITLDDGGEPGKALVALEAAVRVFRELARAHPTVSEWRADLATALYDLSAVQVDLERLDAAERNLDESYRVRKALVEAEPNNRGRQKELATSNEGLGKLWLSRDRLDQALLHAQDAQRLHALLAAAEPSNAGWRRASSVSEELLAEVHRAMKNGPAYLVHARAALAISRALLEEYPDDTKYSEDVEWLVGKFPEAAR